MGRQAGRTAEQTRRMLLDAAAEVARTRGTNFTLDDVAGAAGVSKGGLVYHFASKDDLVLALAADLLEGFRASVASALDPDDHEPGRLTRAWVRACLDDSVDEMHTRRTFALVAQLMTNPMVQDLARADDQRWRDELSGDGLPADVLTLVTTAADGASSAMLWGGSLRTEAHRRLREQLMALTRSPASWRPGQ